MPYQTLVALRPLVRLSSSNGIKHVASRNITTFAAPDGPAGTETNRKILQKSFCGTHQNPGAEATLKRFWKKVGIGMRDNRLCVTLDGRPIKTPSGNTLLLPEDKRMVATLIAAEWENQEILLKPNALPMVRQSRSISNVILYNHGHLQTSIATRALDALTNQNTRSELCSSLLDYLDTDTIW